MSEHCDLSYAIRAPIALATGDPAITMGGFSESGAPTVSAPTVDQLKAFIARGELR